MNVLRSQVCHLASCFRLEPEVTLLDEHEALPQHYPIKKLDVKD